MHTHKYTLEIFASNFPYHKSNLLGYPKIVPTFSGNPQMASKTSGKKRKCSLSSLELIGKVLFVFLKGDKKYFWDQKPSETYRKPDLLHSLMGVRTKLIWFWAPTNVSLSSSFFGGLLFDVNKTYIRSLAK